MLNIYLKVIERIKHYDTNWKKVSHTYNCETRQSIDYYNRNDKLTIVAREKKSFDIMQELYPNTQIILTPDIVLSSNIEMYGVEVSEITDVLLCLRNDAEKNIQ